MAHSCVVILVVMFSVAVLCKPLENGIKSKTLDEELTAGHRLWKRFVNPTFALGSNADATIGKMRTKRSAAEECEKLSLCKLHARSGHNFMAAFQLYFVNKENAKLWDHHAHSMADCQRRFSGCYEDY